MKLHRKQQKEISSATIPPTLTLILGCSLFLAFTLHAAPPAWWSSRGAVNTSLTRDDSAAVTEGQLKQFTFKGIQELNADLTNVGGAGPELSNIVYNWQQDYIDHGYMSPKPDDYQVMNVGQLKYIAGLIYRRLSAAGYTNAPPSWLNTNSVVDNNVANLGQLKTIFDFDLSLSGPTNLASSTNSGGTINLSWTLPSTNNASSFLIEQQDPGGAWTVIATLTNTSLTSYSVTGLSTNQSPVFQVIAQNSTNYSSPNQTPSDPGLITPSDVNAVHGSTDGEIDLSWVNNSTNATYNLIEESDDGLNWHVIAQVPSTNTSYAATNLIIGQSYYFGVAAGNN